MADVGTPNWKEKYLSALETFEADHKKDQQRLDVLRRGLVRVSIAADGLDALLNEQLGELRSHLRNNREIVTLEPLISRLEQTVVALDERRNQDQSSLQTLLDKHLEQLLRLGLPRQEQSTIKKLRKALPGLIEGHGTKLEMWQQVQSIETRIQELLQEKIISLGQQRGGLFSRLFASDKSDSGEESPEQEDSSTSILEISPAFTVTESEERARYETNTAPELALEHTDVPQSELPELVQRLARTLGSLLDYLDVPAQYMQRKEKLSDRVRSGFALDALPSLLEETTQLVASTRMMAQKEFEGFLVGLHHRLQEVQQFLDIARSGEERSAQNQQKLDDEVRRELGEMRISVQGTGDLQLLRAEIEGMVNRIVAAVDSFHHEEKKRRDDVLGHMDHLVKRMVSMEVEATSLKNTLEAQRMEALRDALTELPNRGAYDEQIEREYSRWRRHGHPLSLCIVDVDHFKKINDTLGHQRGDKVLKLVAREISRRIRSEDFVARYGGEEFAIIMPETDISSALIVADKVREAVAECPFSFNNERLQITASFGVASFTEGDTVESCFERADKALYRAKSSGRNRVEVS